MSLVSCISKQVRHLQLSYKLCFVFFNSLYKTLQLPFKYNHLKATKRLNLQLLKTKKNNNCNAKRICNTETFSYKINVNSVSFNTYLFNVILGFILLLSGRTRQETAK